MSSINNFQPRVIPMRHVSPQTPPHVFGMHLVQYGERKGNCMCTAKCCQDPKRGCICSHCAGKDHEFCHVVSAERAKRRAATLRKAGRS